VPLQVSAPEGGRGAPPYGAKGGASATGARLPHLHFPLMGKGLAVFALGAMLFASACAPVDRSRGAVPSGSAEDLRLADVPAADAAPGAARPAPAGLRAERPSSSGD